jgi:hypothetical protein
METINLFGGGGNVTEEVDSNYEKQLEYIDKQRLLNKFNKLYALQHGERLNACYNAAMKKCDNEILSSHMAGLPIVIPYAEQMKREQEAKRAVENTLRQAAQAAVNRASPFIQPSRPFELPSQPIARGPSEQFPGVASGSDMSILMTPVRPYTKSLEQRISQTIENIAKTTSKKLATETSTFADAVGKAIMGDIASYQDPIRAIDGLKRMLAYSLKQIPYKGPYKTNGLTASQRIFEKYLRMKNDENNIVATKHDLSNLVMQFGELQEQQYNKRIASLHPRDLTQIAVVLTRSLDKTSGFKQEASRFRWLLQVITNEAKRRNITIDMSTAPTRNWTQLVKKFPFVFQVAENKNVVNLFPNESRAKK